MASLWDSSQARIGGYHLASPAMTRRYVRPHMGVCSRPDVGFTKCEQVCLNLCVCICIYMYMFVNECTGMYAFEYVFVCVCV